MTKKKPGVKKGHKFPSRTHIPNPSGAPLKHGESMKDWKRLPTIPIHPDIYEKLKAEPIPMSEKVREILAQHYGIAYNK